MAGNSTPETRLEPPDARARILRATFDLIAAEGLGAVTNRRIAAATGVSLGSLTYHFPSQQQLLHECLALHAEEEMARLRRIAEELHAQRLSVGALGERIRRAAADSAARPELMAELELHLYAARNEAVQETSRRCFEAYESLAAAALAAFEVPRPERHAVTVVALMMGLGVKQLGTGRKDAAGLVEGLATIVAGARNEERRNRAPAAAGAERSTMGG